ncbi:hypothetical protein [Magnetofaba australis]|uniref:Transmembrane protein n=1 Tax=Magnetofaba australis IT-1 TaxID=1434232 RepID=A0A1Y2K6L1_9PROT|nr:hypothetical protein [Magnetofaba australis]OSM05281.1 hypothetical protein MAIT1_03450 [Magnetofaba australis IT-1]
MINKSVFHKPALMGIAAAMAVAAYSPSSAKADAAGVATILGATALAGLIYHTTQPVGVPTYGLSKYLSHPSPRGGGAPQATMGAAHVPAPAMPVRYASTQPAAVYAAVSPVAPTMRYQAMGVPVVVSQNSSYGWVPMSMPASPYRVNVSYK